MQKAVEPENDAGFPKQVELARNRNKWLGRTRHPYIHAVHVRYHARKYGKDAGLSPSSTHVRQ